MLRKFFMSISIDVKKRIRHTICGGISAIGTSKGKARNVGRSTVNVGMARIRLELWGWSSSFASLVFNIRIAAGRNISHSKVMFVKPLMLMSIPYGCDVIGQKSCTPPPAI